VRCGTACLRSWQICILKAPLKKMLEQLKQRPEDLSKACSGYKNEAL
jgi:hypothetical protein